MLNSNTYLLIFAAAFMGCVLVTPLVTRIATWLGAIDRPDQFRRIHKGATPRMGGLGLAFGLAVGVGIASAGGYLNEWSGYPRWLVTLLPIGLACLTILAVGVVDDTREMGPRIKLLGQAAAVLILYVGGVRIDSVTLFQFTIPLDYPSASLSIQGFEVNVALPGLFVTMLWFLACMNIWNLIDGMDGLASGVGFLVSGTLTLVAIWMENPTVAILAASLAGSLAGFLLYNWHPACIFLGDSGSLLIGLLIGVVGVQGSLKEGATISILFPILAMGLPITDTAMAIFRRWVRNLPLSSADRRHIHHLLIGLGLNPRQAAALLYCFSAGLCGVVLLGVVFKNEALALIMGLSGCAAFLLILTSRRDELATLRADLASRLARKKQERFAAKLTWEAIQRIELCETTERIWDIMESATTRLGCDHLKVSCRRNGHSAFEQEAWADERIEEVEPGGSMSGSMATFRLTSGRDLLLIVTVQQAPASTLEPDIAFRFVQRLSLASAERLERLFANEIDPEAGFISPSVVGPEALIATPMTTHRIDPSPVGTPAATLNYSPSARPSIGWLREALGWSPASVTSARSLGEE
ncbi:MraY family glycosyltransferase [Tundrisphaera lichenicola]|uniref:MraY family glycosyltransferase n=1 Tax=Tundrisphaera lichenicola TaxID=2029860 RepID=UPI003EBDB875